MCVIETQEHCPHGCCQIFYCFPRPPVSEGDNSNSFRLVKIAVPDDDENFIEDSVRNNLIGLACLQIELQPSGRYDCKITKEPCPNIFQITW